MPNGRGAGRFHYLPVRVSGQTYAFAGRGCLPAFPQLGEASDGCERGCRPAIYLSRVFVTERMLAPDVGSWQHFSGLARYLT